MVSIRVELSARYVHERAAREPNDSVAVRPHGPRRGIRGRASVPTNPDCRCSKTACTEGVYEPVGCDPALIVRTARVDESWITSQECIDVLAHQLSMKRTSGEATGRGSSIRGALWEWRVSRVTWCSSGARVTRSGRVGLRPPATGCSVATCASLETRPLRAIGASLPRSRGRLGEEARYSVR
jgi:hypothetical protein